jgi:hypothetical protein
MSEPVTPSGEGGLDQFLAELRRSAGAEGAPRTPPVHLWNPERCVNDAGFEILKDGSWRHEGVRITREQLVRLFATILRKDADGEVYLVTPGEKVRVAVEDAPFLGIRVDRRGEGRAQEILVTTNVGDVFAIGPAHSLRSIHDAATGEPRPYAHVRHGLEARILRAPFYELADWAEPDLDGRLGVWSGGVWWGLS